MGDGETLFAKRTLKMFYFYKPLEMLYLLFPLVFLGLSFYLWKRQKKKGMELFGKDFFTKITSSVSWTKRRLRLYLELLSICFIILTLARPLLKKPQEGKQELEGVEIILAVDVSRSMLAEDVRPSRLRFVKSELGHLLENLTGNKVGLIAFAGNASVISPLTVDLGAVKMFVESLSPSSVDRQGTLFRPVLNLSLELFKQGGGVDKEGQQPSRLILLISDGEDHDKEVMRLAKELVQDGINVFTMVVGTEKGAPIPIKNEDGKLLTYKRDSGGEMILSKRRDHTLRKLAKLGKGGFYSMSFQSDYLQIFLKDLQSLEKTRFTDLTNIGSAKELYGYFLFLALCFLFLFFLITERKKVSFISFLFLFLSPIFSLQKASAFPLDWSMASNSQAFWNNRKALKFMKEKGKDIQKAHIHLNKALSQSPFEPALYLNMGILFILKEERDKAYSAFLYGAQWAQRNLLQKPKKAVYRDLLFAALFNLALLETEKKEWDKALSFYQQALFIWPNSVEVRTNIELLQQQRQQQKQNQNQKNQQQQSSGKQQQQEQKDQPDQQQQPENKQNQGEERKTF